MFDDVRLSHYFTSGFFLFSRDEPFLLGPTRTQPQVLSKAAADGDRWHPYINRTLFYWSSFSGLFWYSLISPAINCFFKCSPLSGSAELYNNLGLCCFFAQQYDMTLTCFQVAPNSNCRTSNQTKATNARLIQTFPLQRALATAEDETLAEVDAVSTIF